MDPVRRPYQGVWNIIRFNCHFYLAAMGAVLILLFLATYAGGIVKIAASILSMAILSVITISLLISYYVYDLSSLYDFHWLKLTDRKITGRILNIHSGFDDTTYAIKEKYPKADLRVYDFYDEKKHREVSIRRARSLYSPYPGTKSISTDHIPEEDNSVEKVFLILAAHEIRDEEERTAFFSEVARVLKPGGKVVVTEHLRDAYNFMAFSIGFFHFHPKSSWLRNFHDAGLKIAYKSKITPFVTIFVLENAGSTSSDSREYADSARSYARDLPEVL